jgi:hypothetical protein
VKVVTLREKAQRIAARRAAIGGVTEERIERARNRGSRRTPDKRALLDEIAREAERQGRENPFRSYY